MFWPRRWLQKKGRWSRTNKNRCFHLYKTRGSDPPCVTYFGPPDATSRIYSTWSFMNRWAGLTSPFYKGVSMCQIQDRFQKRQAKRRVPKAGKENGFLCDLDETNAQEYYKKTATGWAGGRDLSSSAEYTGFFCLAVRRAWESDRKSADIWWLLVPKWW